jgi:hypothetical protein
MIIKTTHFVRLLLEPQDSNALGAPDVDFIGTPIYR